MPVEYTDFAQIPIPDEFGVDDLPYWFSQQFSVVDKALIFQATDTDDRDSKFYLAPQGSVCAIVDDTDVVQGLYIKTSLPGSSQWGTVWKAPAALAWTNLSLATDMTLLSVAPSITISDDNRWATLRGDVQTISTATLSNGLTIATIPDQFTVDGLVKIPCAINQIPTYWGVGYVVIDPATNNINTWGITAAAQPQWAALWGIRFPCHQ